jgi:hypothetical protein
MKHTGLNRQPLCLYCYKRIWKEVTGGGSFSSFSSVHPGKCPEKISQLGDDCFLKILSNSSFMYHHWTLYTECPTWKRSIFWEVTVSVILRKKVRTVSEIELFHCTLYRRATRHVLTRVAKCIDVDGGIFENVLY